jgi:hypothetical protein
MIYKIINTFCLSLMVFILLSCSAERNLAREYVKSHRGEGIMLAPVDFLYKQNLGAYIDFSMFPARAQQDSIAYNSSNYVQYISDSIFLTFFTNSLIDKLVSFGYNVTLDESADVFLNSGNPSWIIQLSQLQLEENFTPGYVYAYDEDDEEYYQVFRQNSITLNSWLEINHLNTENARKQMLYLSGYIEDYPGQDVSLTYFDGQFYFNDARDTISTDDIYKMAVSSGKKHAELLFDYFLNDYIRLNLPKNAASRREMHYNHRLKKIEAGLIERFDVVR